MDDFSQAYAKVINVLSNQKFSGEFEKTMQDSCIKSLFEDDGPNHTHAGALTKIRRAIKDSTKRGRFTGFILGDGVQDVIMSAAKNDTSLGNFNERVATIKFIKHFYHVRKSGSRSLWVLSTPKKYSKWVFDELKGFEIFVKLKLSAESEVYTKQEKKMMADALQLASAWTQKAGVLLSTPSNTEKAIVKRWFDDGTMTDTQVNGAIAKLIAGLSKVHNVTNSNKLVFSDEPLDRNNGGWKDWAFVYSSESQNVIYMQNAFLKAGNSGKLWMCALTIIHELTHREVNTDDHKYDTDGLKPHTVRFPKAKTIENADTWAYFVTDLVGMLSKSDRKKYLK